MARLGVTYQEVANAANQLKGEDKNPTIENIRRILGTGSIGTINNHLRKWKEIQNSTQKIANAENLPEELVSLLKGLWERVIHQAEERVMTLEEKYQKTIAELTDEVHKYKTNNQRWQQLYNQWLQEKNKLASENTSLEAALAQQQKENVLLIAKHEAFVNQLEEKQVRIDELYRLHQQTQANLEHYREAAREQRLLDQHQYEQQKQALERQINNLTMQTVDLNQRLNLLQQESHALQQTHFLLEKEHTEVLAEGQQLTSKLLASEAQNNERAHLLQHLKTQHQALQAKLENEEKQNIELQLETRMLTQKLTETKQMLTQALDQNKLLGHDKWTIAQEKALLEGQLKQMQVLLPT